MSDVEDELLALAGGASSDESDNEPPSPKEAKSTKKTTAKKAAPKKRRQDDSEEEGEASSSPRTPDSQGSASMDESDSDSDSPAPPRSADKIESKYPVDGLFVSRAEKAEIMSMREVDREQIIAERTAEVEQERQNRLLRQLVNSQELEEKRQKKRKAEEPEEGQRKTSRQRTKLGGTKVGETSAGIDSLKRARAEKSDRQRRREEDLQRQKDKNISPTARRGGDDYDRSDSSDVEWASPSRSRAEPAQEPEKEAPMAELRDVEHIRLGRSRFADVYYKPTLEAAIKDCFAKVRYPGPDKDKADEYRMGMIKGIQTGRGYVIETRSGPKVTDLYVQLAFGKTVREFPFILCSDSRFTEAEWIRYKSTCQAEGVSLPKVPAINKKIAQLNELIKYKLTNDEINRKVDHENALRLKYGDRLAFRTSLTADNNRPLSEAQKQQESLAQVNLANRRINAERVRKSQLAERAKMRQVEEALARGEAVQIDPSSRVRTRAKFIHDVNEDAVALAAKKAATSAALAAALGASKEADATNGRSASITPNGTPRLLASRPAVLPHVAKVQAMQSNKDKNGMPTFHRPLMDDDVIGALDLDIDVEI